MQITKYDYAAYKLKSMFLKYPTNDQNSITFAFLLMSEKVKYTQNIFLIFLALFSFGGRRNFVEIKILF